MRLTECRVRCLPADERVQRFVHLHAAGLDLQSRMPARPEQVTEDGLVSGGDDDARGDPVALREALGSNNEEIAPVWRQMGPIAKRRHERVRVHPGDDATDEVSQQRFDEHEVKSRVNAGLLLDAVVEVARSMSDLATADRSLAMVDYALRRRFAFVNLRPRFDHPKFRHHLSTRGVPAKFIDRIIDRIGTLNEDIRRDVRHLGPGFEIGHSYFCEPAGDREQWYRSVVQHELGPLLREYWFDDPAKAEGAIATLLA